MSRFLPEPPPATDSKARAGIVLVNLGTPEAPTPKAVRSFLREFLSDPRVVELPRILWWPILNLFILPRRPARSAEKYARIWDKEGSPLAVHTTRQAKLLQGYLVQAGNTDTPVVHAMRYGQPDLLSALMRLKAAGADRVLILPLYPHYAASTTASIFDALGTATKQIRNLPSLRFVRGFHDDPDYIDALAAAVTRHWHINGRPDRLVMSFHGVPRAAAKRGDPYPQECLATARLLADRLKLQPDQYLVTFQSRFGRAEWLKPYTEASLRELAGQGVKTVDVICPGFVSDCLETLEEIAIECKAAFLSSGGREFRYIPCLNEDHAFMAALRNIACRNMNDWLTPPGQTDSRGDTAS